MLGSLAVDTVYPAAGFHGLCDSEVRKNELKLQGLSERWRPWQVDGRWLIAGSHAEDLCVGDYLGHGVGDLDEMRLLFGDLRVYVLTLGQKPPEDAILVYKPQQYPPAYTHLQVLHKDWILGAIVERSRSNNLSVSRLLTLPWCPRRSGPESIGPPKPCWKTLWSSPCYWWCWVLKITMIPT